jgi:hypothetical protein
MQAPLLDIDSDEFVQILLDAHVSGTSRYKNIQAEERNQAEGIVLHKVIEMH